MHFSTALLTSLAFGYLVVVVYTANQEVAQVASRLLRVLLRYRRIGDCAGAGFA
jgi:hypothetical protein